MCDNDKNPVLFQFGKDVSPWKRIYSENGFTQTPRLIQEKIDATAKDCENFISCIFEKTGIFPYKEIKQEALFDLKIFVEKYASVTYEDRSIFYER